MILEEYGVVPSNVLQWNNLDGVPPEKRVIICHDYPGDGKTRAMPEIIRKRVWFHLSLDATISNGGDIRSLFFAPPRFYVM